jgi:uncharacterized protein (TIGR03382 family)
MEGGLGSPCTNNSDCASNTCASDSSGNSYCVSACDPNASTCPSNFTCEDVGGGNGVCWPGGGNNNNGNGSSGGCNTSGSSGSTALLGLGLGAMLITRRRRR